MNTIAFGARSVGLDKPPLMVAELSGNHNGSLERALALVDAAAQAGAHAIKLQTYTADTMTIDAENTDFIVKDAKSLWNGRKLYELYSDAATPWEWHEALFSRAQSQGMACFSTPFDETAIAFLEAFSPPAYKIASFELTDLPLIRAAAATRRPIIMSLGMATVSDIDEAVRTARSHGADDIVLLKCTSTYPASPADSNIASIPHLRSLFGCEVGISDHTMGIGVSVAAIALGAVMVEKHLTLSRADGGVDAPFSMEPAEFASLVLEAERAWQARGSVRYGPSTSEVASLQFRRSVYVVRDVRAGEEFTPLNLRIIRPGFGLAPKHYDAVLGRRARMDISRGTALQWNFVS